MVFSPPKAIPRKNPFGNAAKLKDKNEQPKKKADSPPPPKGKKDAPVDAAKKELEKAKEMAAKMEEKQEQAFCRWCAACDGRAVPCKRPGHAFLLACVRSIADMYDANIRDALQSAGPPSLHRLDMAPARTARSRCMPSVPGTQHATYTQHATCTQHAPHATCTTRNMHHTQHAPHATCRVNYSLVLEHDIGIDDAAAGTKPGEEVISRSCFAQQKVLAHRNALRLRARTLHSEPAFVEAVDMLHKYSEAGKARRAPLPRVLQYSTSTLVPHTSTRRQARQAPHRSLQAAWCILYVTCCMSHAALV